MIGTTEQANIGCLLLEFLHHTHHPIRKRSTLNSGHEGGVTQTHRKLTRMGVVPLFVTLPDRRLSKKPTDRTVG
jgi:hypothetical protein